MISPILDHLSGYSQDFISGKGDMGIWALRPLSGYVFGAYEAPADYFG